VLYSKIEDKAEYIKDINKIITALENCYNNSILENFIQNPAAIARCFIEGSYYYNTKAILKVEYLKNFLVLLKTTSNEKKRLILNNLWQRIDSIKRYTISQIDDDLPF